MDKNRILLTYEYTREVLDLRSMYLRTRSLLVQYVAACGCYCLFIFSDPFADVQNPPTRLPLSGVVVDAVNCSNLVVTLAVTR